MFIHQSKDTQTDTPILDIFLLLECTVFHFENIQNLN